MDDKLREIYAVGAGKQADRRGLPTVARYAKKLNYPEHRMYERAGELGLRRAKEPMWSDQELRIMQKAAHLSCYAIQQRLKKAGYHRTELAIMTRLRVLRLRANTPYYTARQLAMCLGFYGVDPISRWVRQGLITPTYKGTERKERGDVMLFHETEIRRFILENQTLVDLRKVDQYWFFEVMFEGEGMMKVTDALRDPKSDTADEDDW